MQKTSLLCAEEIHSVYTEEIFSLHNAKICARGKCLQEQLFKRTFAIILKEKYRQNILRLGP